MKKILRLTGGKPAFFLCDIQDRFRSTIHLFPAVIHTAQKLVEATKILDCPLIVTEQYPKALGKIVPELEVKHAACIDEKTRFSMLTDSVQTSLEKLNTKTAVLFGIESHVCVLQTAMDLQQSGFDVFVVADGVSSSNRAEIPVALERMKKFGCVVTTSDSLLFEIVGDAKHAKFKEISDLVKRYMKSEHHNLLLLNTSAI